MSEAARNLSALLEDVLDVSRVEAGMLTPKKEQVSLAALFKNVTDTLAPAAAEKNLTLQVQEADLTALADPKLLRRVVMNLVSNAIKFTEKGTVTLRARQDETHTWIDVQDSGIGLSQAQIKGLFQKYHQVHEEKPGYGLGLFISRQIVQAHGGTLEVVSALGEGSTFTIGLPKENV